MSGPVLILALVVGLGQLAVEVAALVSLYRAPAVTFGNKWIWVAIIVIGGLLGALVYFIVGRQPVSVREPQTAEVPQSTAAVEGRSQSAVDLLYGDKEER